MPNVFISYRRNDNPDAAGRIYDRMVEHFGEQSVFFDIDSVPFGIDFRKHVDKVVSQCDIVLVVIGDHWLAKEDGKQTRLEDPADLVRMEIETALRRGIPVIPVPVGNANVPRESDLPEAIRDLAYRNAAEVRSGTAFRGHLDRLIRGIESLAPETSRPPPVRDGRARTRALPPGATRGEWIKDAWIGFFGLGGLTLLGLALTAALPTENRPDMFFQEPFVPVFAFVTSGFAGALAIAACRRNRAAIAAVVITVLMCWAAGLWLDPRYEGTQGGLLVGGLVGALVGYAVRRLFPRGE
jgi:hypothetical protein